MRLLHPMMPFLTEEVWQLLGQVAPSRGLGEPGGPPPRGGVKDAAGALGTLKSGGAELKSAVGAAGFGVEAVNSGAVTPRLAGLVEESVCVAQWPVANAAHQDPTIEQQFADFQAVLGAVREARQRQNIAFKEDLNFTVRCDDATAKLLEPMQPYFQQMTHASATEFGPNAKPQGVPISFSLTGQHGPMEVHVDVSQFIDVGAERKRLEKERDNLNKQIASIDGKLSNQGFVAKAPPEVVQQQRAKLEELRGQLASVIAALKKLGE